MNWSDECQYHIDETLANSPLDEVLAVTISQLIEAKINLAFCNCKIGGMPQFDPRRDVDFYERQLAAALTELKGKLND